MGGDCEIFSRPNAGSRIVINLPIQGRMQNA
jgi:chemotaxis protein histidine kinase CheA